jgi:5-methylcytosine-specific restriction endonuclease McrA
MNILNQPVLVLNAAWQPIDEITVKEAFVAMLGGAEGKNPPALAIDAAYPMGKDGQIDWNMPDFTIPVDWDTWLQLPVREYDLAVHTHNRAIRAPRQILQPNYARMPDVTPKPTKANIRRRDNNIDQYTGKPLSWKESNIDHVIPRDQGGKNTFENMVTTSKIINTLKANKRPEQVGLKLIRKPKAPKSLPKSATITVAEHPSWVAFMTVVKEIRSPKK